MTILSSLLYTSIIGIVSLVGYKYIISSRHNVIDYDIHIPDRVSLSRNLKQKLRWLFTSANDMVVKKAIIRAKNTYEVAAKSISQQHTAFTDAVNGKGLHNKNINQKGATSLFLKRVSEHKKKIQEDRSENK